MSGDFTVLFDVSREPLPGWGVGLFGAAMVAVGLSLVFLAEHWGTRLLGAIFAVSAVIVCTTIVVSLWNEYGRLRAQLENGEVRFLVGVAEDFRRPPVGQHGPQTFSVSGHRFEVWQAEHTAAFHHTVTAGGPNLSGRCIRVGFTSRNEIVWLGLRASQPAPDNESCG